MEQFLSPPPIRTQSDPGGNVGLGVTGGVTDPFVVATIGAVIGFGLQVALPNILDDPY